MKLGLRRLAVIMTILYQLQQECYCKPISDQSFPCPEYRTMFSQSNLLVRLQTIKYWILKKCINIVVIYFHAIDCLYCVEMFWFFLTTPNVHNKYRRPAGRDSTLNLFWSRSDFLIINIKRWLNISPTLEGKNLWAKYLFS